MKDKFPLLEEFRAVVYHGGAGGGMHRSFEKFSTPLKYVSFDPNSQSQSELNKLKKNSKKSSFIEHDVAPIAVGDKIGRRKFYEYRPYYLSSFLQLEKHRSWRYGNEKEQLVSSSAVAVSTIDHAARERKEEPNFICLDIQGYELKALCGAERVLKRSVLGIRCEVNFIKIYRDMPSLDNISEFLGKRGFILARLEKCGSGQTGISTDCGPFSVSWDDARPAWADAIYLKSAEAFVRGLALVKQPEVQITQYLSFCFSNSCDSLGLDMLLCLSESRFRNSPKKLPLTLRKSLLSSVHQHLKKAGSAKLNHAPELQKQYRRYQKDLLKYLNGLQ